MAFGPRGISSHGRPRHGSLKKWLPLTDVRLEEALSLLHLPANWMRKRFPDVGAAQRPFRRSGGLPRKTELAARNGMTAFHSSRSSGWR